MIAVVNGSSSPTNPELVERWRLLGLDARLLRSDEAVGLLGPGDVALARIDVRRTLDGVEPGMLDVLALMRAGVRVLNRPAALLTAHDKLRTARALRAAGLPHPATAHLRPGDSVTPLEPPLVVKPRFGSWGVDVFLCATREEVEETLAEISGRSWFRHQGALVQDLVPPCGHDLRVLVAGGTVVGAIERRAAPGEWRTNYSLGGTLEPAVPGQVECELAIAAAAAVGADFVGVDLLPDGSRPVIVEVNGAVDFRPEYSQPGRDVHLEIALALGLPVPAPVY